jgi:hypothetical protein
MWSRASEAIPVVEVHVRLHVAEANDASADVALGGTVAIGVFVGREVGEEDGRVGRVGVGGGLLRDGQVAEPAEDRLGGAGGCAVGGERGEGGKGKVATGAWEGDGRMEDGVVVGVGGGSAAEAIVVGAVPVVFPVWGGFEEDIMTVWAADVVAVAERFVQREGALGDVLLAVFANDFVGSEWRIAWGAAWVWGRVGGCLQSV